MFFTLLNVHINKESKEQHLKRISQYLAQIRSEKALTIVTPNPEQLVLAQKDTSFRRILNSADIALPDGVGTIWALKILASRIIERIPGIEFMEQLISLASQKHFPVGIIGGRNYAALSSFKFFQEKYPGLEGWAEDGPEVQIENGELIVDNSPEKTNAYFKLLSRRIQNSGVRIVFVGLGAPKQEYIIQKLKHSLSSRHHVPPKEKQSQFREVVVSSARWRIPRSDYLPVILMSVGGAFDIISGKIPRAPQMMRRLNLEWLWRLVKQPWRIKRQLRLLEFVWLVIKERVSGKI